MPSMTPAMAPVFRPRFFSSRLRTLLIKAIAVASLAQCDSDSTRKSTGCVVTSVPAGK
jgi:hypothetical protein